MSEANEWADIEAPSTIEEAMDHGYAEGRRAAAEAESAVPPREFAHLALFIEQWFCEIGWQDTDSSSSRTW